MSSDVFWTYQVDCSRWEIGEEPQHVVCVFRTPQPDDCSRWEIGEEPQLMKAVTKGKCHCSRWEIGEEPQPCGPGNITLAYCS